MTPRFPTRFLVRVKGKYQVTLPSTVRKRLKIAVGDVLEARVDRGKVILTPKSRLDRDLADALRDVEAGRGHGPFPTVKEFLRDLHARARRRTT